MPYNGPNDENLPANVKKLPVDQRQKWVEVWNKTYKNCRDPKMAGQGSEEKCEEIAFKIANGTIKKEMSVVEEKTDNKMLEAPVNIAEEAPKPFGGATSFEEAEEWKRARDQALQVDEVTYTAQSLISNALNDEDVSGRPNKLQTIVDGMRERLATVLANTAKAIEPKEKESEKQTTKTEEGTLFRQTDYAVVGDIEKPSTWKLRLAEERSGNFTVAQVARAITAMQPGGFRGQKVDFEPGEKLQAVKRISAAINKVDGTDDQKENLRRRLNRVKELKEPAFTILKDREGNMRWWGMPSNKWRDRDMPAQIIEEKAHKEFVEYLDKTKEYPILLSWHTPGTRIGVADFCDYTNGFLVMGGPIDKDKYAIAEKLAEKCQKGDIGMSHGFVYTYSDKEKEVIGQYRAWEVSHLPMGHAANVWTSIDILSKEVNLMLHPDKRKYLVDLHGEEAVDALEAKASDLEKDMLSLGAEFKDIAGEPEGEPATITAEDAVKAVVENEHFKALIESIKELTETTIPDLTKRLEAVEAKAEDANSKAGKSVDDIVADAMSAKSKGFQASKEGPEPSDEEKKDVSDDVMAAAIEPDMVQGLIGSRKVS